MPMEACQASNFNLIKYKTMETTTTSKKDEIISGFMTYVLEHNKRPHNIYKFAKEIDLEESDFYQHFPSFEILEKEIFNEFFNKTLLLLDDNEDYQEYDTKNKLLSFYFTFFELLTRNRSYVLQNLESDKIKVMHITSILRKNFKKYIESLEIKTINLPDGKLENYKEKGITEAYWGQLLFLMKFWKNDTSVAFEKTDVLIEKMVVTSFQIQDIKPLESIFDLGKFIYKEVVNR